MDFFLNIPNKVDMILRMLRSSGFSSYVVGGSIRDKLLGKEPDDWDVATSADPEEVETCFTGYKVIETGIKHGTVTLVMDGESFEITTFREDGKYSDGRHPDSVSFSKDIKADLSRRDFTMNALAYSPDEGLVDEYGGLDDIERRVIRTVGDPGERFSEDVLRVLRAIRFVSTIGFDMERNTAAAVREMAGTVEKAAKERVRVELDKLFTGAYAAYAISRYRKEINEILAGTGAHIADRKSVKALEHAPVSLPLRLALLIDTEDSNKLLKIFGISGASTNAGDEELSKFRDALKALKYDNETIKRAAGIKEVSQRDIRPDETVLRLEMRRLAGAFGDEEVPEILQDGISVKSLKDRLPDSETERYFEALSGILESGKCYSRGQLDLKGEDLAKAGVPEGPEVGRILDALLDEVIAGELVNEKAALLTRAEALRDMFADHGKSTQRNK